MSAPRHTPRWLTVLTPLLVLAACGGGEQEAARMAEEGAATAEPLPTMITVADAGFATPESVLHDTTADIYLVSNINGTPLDKDDNGFISRLSPDGQVLELKWIDGAAEDVTLNAPKGLAVQGDVLYVADIDCVRMFDRTTGAPSGETCVEGATFLNDVAPDPDGGVYVTDSGLDASFAPTGADAVYHVQDGHVTPLIADAGLGAPNGVVADGGDVLVVTFMSGEVYRVAEDGTRTSILAASDMQLDGIQVLPDGRILISSWGDSCIYAVTNEGVVECVVANVQAPADIGVDETRNRVLIPLFNANEVRIQPIG